MMDFADLILIVSFLVVSSVILVAFWDHPLVKPIMLGLAALGGLAYGFSKLFRKPTPLPTGGKQRAQHVLDKLEDLETEDPLDLADPDDFNRVANNLLGGGSPLHRGPKEGVDVPGAASGAAKGTLREGGVFPDPLDQGDGD